MSDKPPCKCAEMQPFTTEDGRLVEPWKAEFAYLHDCGYVLFRNMCHRQAKGDPTEYARLLAERGVRV